jgi:propanol-preferring alcohol dehydrogenase
MSGTETRLPARIPETMRAMILEQPKAPLVLREAPVPRVGLAQILLRVAACGVCRTDLHIADGELTDPKLPLILGHEIVGRVVEVGEDVDEFSPGDRVGVPWLGWTDGSCRYCEKGLENLCENARFTGYTIDGGFAEYALADARYAFRIPDAYDDLRAAPLLCAGLIGYRAYRMIGDARRIGLYGFGAAAHILAQVARHDGRNVYAFTKPGDANGQDFARRLGAVWAGDSTARPPDPLDAAILFAPVGALVVEALKSVDRGGTVVCAGIHMSDVPAFPYRLLWEERTIRSLANLTREDGAAFLHAAAQVPIETTVTPFPLGQADVALSAIRDGKIEGAAVLSIGAEAR